MKKETIKLLISWINLVCGVLIECLGREDAKLIAKRTTELSRALENEIE